MGNFCYWQEESNIGMLNIPQSFKKICLLRYEEYKIEKEIGIKNTTNIFCPYINMEQAEECMEYKVSRLNK